MHRFPLARAAVLAAGVACLAAPTTMADFIVCIDQGDVWSSRPDGSGRVQLTDGGDWHSPTQADDGTKIAYAYVAYSCPVASSCGTIQRSTFYTASDVTEATPHSVCGNQFGVSDPEWVTRRARSSSAATAARSPSRTWAPGTTPRRRGWCRTPTWATARSPDGTRVAYESSRGIQIVRLTKLDASGCETTGDNAVLTPTGSPVGPVDAAGPAQGPPRPGHGAQPRKVTVKLTAGRRTIASGSARAERAGTFKVRLSKVRRAKAARPAGRKLRVLARQARTPGKVTGTLRLR